MRTVPEEGSRSVGVRHVPPRLQRRIAVSIAFAVLVTLLLSGIALVLSKRSSLIRTMETGAVTYTRLVSMPVTWLVALERPSGNERLHRKLAELMELNREVEKIVVADAQGRMVLEADRDEVTTYPVGSGAPVIEDPELLDAIRGFEVRSWRLRRPGGGRIFRVVVPVKEEFGRHTYALIATFDYTIVNREVMRTALTTVMFLIVGLAIAYWSSIPLARGISQSLERLHHAVTRIADGHFSERVDVRSEDEIEDLARAFNTMAEELEKTIGELQDAYRELLTLERAKDDMVANVSHELKTPMTALRGYLELLAEGQLGELTPEASKAVEVCRRNLGRLAARIEEMMMVARAERGGEALTMEPIAVEPLLRGIEETLLPRIEEKGITFSLELAEGVGSIVGSAEHIERVFTNIIDNAIKFTPEGGTIALKAEPQRRRGLDGVLFRIVDSGPGIAPEHLNRVFERFYQTDPSASRLYGGMGLGLSLVRTIVESHGGVVWAESRRGEGAAFLVWLPLEGRTPSGAHRRIEPKNGQGDRMEDPAGRREVRRSGADPSGR